MKTGDASILQVQYNFNGSNPDRSFTMSNSFLDPCGLIYETSTTKFLHLYFHAVIFSFYI